MEQPPESSALPTDGRAVRLWRCVRQGTPQGLKTAGWLLKIMVPVSLGVTILSWSGALRWLGGWLNGPFALVGLPAETVVPFLAGVFLNIYSAIAALGAIPLTDRQLTILALAVLISHNFFVEATVQHKVGTPMWRIVLLRLVASFVGALALNWLLPTGDGVATARGAAVAAEADLWSMLTGWFWGTAALAGKVAAIVIGLMILQRILREFGWIQILSKAFFPLLWLLGLPRRTAFLWIVANTLGLAYGSAVLLEERHTGRLSHRDAHRLNRSIAICHSLLEDTLLFVALGAWALWITVPRMALAAGAVWLYLGARRLRLTMAWAARRRKITLHNIDATRMKQ